MTALVVSLPESNFVCWEQFEVGGFVTALHLKEAPLDTESSIPWAGEVLENIAGTANTWIC